jgi:hypothetical protein
MNVPTDWLPLASFATALLLVSVRTRPRVARFNQWSAKLVRRLSSRRVMACVVAAALTMGIRSALLPIWPKPVPRIFDEFSYLLMADTFASGRATNPTPPHWEHFETMFVQLVPTYQSVYPAAQGLFLAMGMLTMGHPWWGVWLEMGLFAAFLCWMLQGWLPPRWALFGSLLALLQFGITSYWMNSYWGGAPGAIGGALLLGSWPRVARRPTRRNAVIMAVGIVLLANSRPWEGFWLTAVVLISLALDYWKKRAVRWAIFAPAIVVLVALSMLTAWYFWRVTGSPFRMPYQVAFDQYAAGGTFFWEPLKHPYYRHPVLERFYVSMATELRAGYSSAAGILGTTAAKLYAIARFYTGPLVFCLLFMLPALVVNKRSRRLLLCLAVVFGAMFVSAPMQVHYAAPVASLLILISTLALRRFWLLQRRGWTVGLYLLPAMGMLMLMSSVVAVSEETRPNQPTPRAQVLAALSSTGSKHLVLVRYSPVHDANGEEWVYNDADLQNSGVIWARDMGDDKNRQLLQSFKDRRAWLIEPDSVPLKLNGYQ